MWLLCSSMAYRRLLWVIENGNVISDKPLFLLCYFSFQGGRKVEFPIDPKVIYIFKNFYSRSISMKVILV